MTVHSKERVREELLGKLADLSRRNRREGLVHERCNDPMDQVQNRFEMDFAISAINKDWQTRRSVERALERLADGEYGKCQECAGEIAPQRLRAIPWTTKCVHCQERQDGSGTAGSRTKYGRYA